MQSLVKAQIEQIFLCDCRLTYSETKITTAIFPSLKVLLAIILDNVRSVRRRGSRIHFAFAALLHARLRKPINPTALKIVCLNPAFLPESHCTHEIFKFLAKRSC